MKRFATLLLAALALTMGAMAQAQQPPPASLGGYDSRGNAYLPWTSQYEATGSWSFLTTAYTNGTTSFTPALVMPSVPTGVTVPGRCVLYWQTNNTSASLTLGLGLSNVNSSIQVMNTSHSGANGATLADTQTLLSNTLTVSAISSALSPGSASTIYRDDVDLLLTPGTGGTVVTVYGKSNSASYIVSLMPGSKCVWGS